MQFAIDSSGEKIHISDAEIGKNYYCQICQNKMIQRHGSIRIHHFAHYSSRGEGGFCRCSDDWHYDMSDWHVEWQNRFPKDCQEIVISSNSKKHIADIRIKNVVVEFQHSPIKYSEFLDRNRFYTSAGYRVVWVFDLAEPFIENKISNVRRNNQYEWGSPWTVFRNLVFDDLDDVTLYFQLGYPENMSEDRVLEKITKAYSTFKTFFTDVDHALSVNQFVDFVNESNPRLFFKKYKPEEPVIHAVDGGKTLFDLWQYDYTGIMVKNLANNKIMAVNGSRGFMNGGFRGENYYIYGYYARVDSVTGRYKVDKRKQYVVWQAEDPVWKLLNCFKAKPEILESWKTEREERERRIQEANNQEQKEREERRKKEILRQQREEEERRRKQAEEQERIAKYKQSWDDFRNGLDQMLDQQDSIAIDPDGKRWVKCGCCGNRGKAEDFMSYGGAHPNLGLCKDCSRAGKSFVVSHSSEEDQRHYNSCSSDKCPWCGGTLIDRFGKFGRFIGCSNYPKCKFTL